MRLGKRCGGGDASLMNPRNWPVYRQLTSNCQYLWIKIF